MEKKITTIPVLALGKSATRVAQNLNAQLGAAGSVHDDRAAR